MTHDLEGSYKREKMVKNVDVKALVGRLRDELDDTDCVDDRDALFASQLKGLDPAARHEYVLLIAREAWEQAQELNYILSILTVAIRGTRFERDIGNASKLLDEALEHLSISGCAADGWPNDVRN